MKVIEQGEEAMKILPEKQSSRAKLLQPVDLVFIQFLVCSDKQHFFTHIPHSARLIQSIIALIYRNEIVRLLII